MNCLLCRTHSTLFYENTFQCENCGLVFKSPDVFLTNDEERKRYSFHQNNFNDEGYRKFLGQIVDAVKPFIHKNMCGLDFGCGPAPVLSSLLREESVEMSNYDPTFLNDTSVLQKDFYDLVITTEVVEHFKNPQEEFEILYSLVKKNGLLAIMTKQFSKNIHYRDWYYKNDPTHVVFYSEKTFNFLCKIYNYEKIFDDKNSIVILKKR